MTTNAGPSDDRPTPVGTPQARDPWAVVPQPQPQPPQPQPYPPPPYPPQPYGLQPYPYAPTWGGPGPIGQVRSTGLQILLTVVTLGIWPLVWYYLVHDEMQRHKRTGLGGGVALVLAFFASVVMPFLTANEVGELYERRGMRKPVSGLTGLWYIPGFLLLVGPLVWFIKTNGALNAYWRSQGAR
ncbi:MAG: conserved rane protein of unknown function [Mycobacterium sp.]|nr:conserved rane protein of unknown function [Mycobacterium sp.]